MIDFTEVRLVSLAIHQVGNKLRQEELLLSNEIYTPKDSNLEELLMRYFLSPFRSIEQMHQFSHPTDIRLNEIYAYTSEAFEDYSTLLSVSMNCAKLLYQKSTHPKVRRGELYVALFEDCIIAGKKSAALGLFKSENKNTYLKVAQNQEKFELNYEKGIDVTKLDKGCLIFNVDKQNGFKLMVVDAVRSDQEAVYWKDEFLQTQSVQDEAFHTKSYLNVCKDYCRNVLGEQADKTEQIAFLKESVKYFENKKDFTLGDFAQKVLKEPEQINSFTNYVKAYEEQQGVEYDRAFKIEGAVVKKEKKKFNDFISLDTDIEIRIKGSGTENQQFVEKGFDEQKGMHFYKVFFNKEK